MEKSGAYFLAHPVQQTPNRQRDVIY